MGDSASRAVTLLIGLSLATLSVVSTTSIMLRRGAPETAMEAREGRALAVAGIQARIAKQKRAFDAQVERVDMRLRRLEEKH